MLRPQPSQIQKQLDNKNIAQLHSLFHNSQLHNLNLQQYFAHSYQIFAMLTHPEVELPTFVRRNYVFDMFEAVIRMRTLEGCSVGETRKKLEYLVKIMEGMFWAVAAGRNVDLDMHVAFHKFVVKFLNFCTNKNNQPTQTLQKKMKILQQVYQLPPTKPTEPPTSCQSFTLPSILLWYQLFLTLRNSLQLHNQPISCMLKQITKIRTHTLTITQPVLKWVNMYNLLTIASKMLVMNGSVRDVEECCLGLCAMLMVEVRQGYGKYFGGGDDVEGFAKVSQETKDNVFRISVRFGLISLAFTIVDCIKLKQHNRQGLLLAKQQITLTCNLMLPKIHNQKHSQQQLSQRLLKYYLQLKYIQHKLTHTSTSTSTSTSISAPISISIQSSYSLYLTTEILKQIYRQGTVSYEKGYNTNMDMMKKRLEDEMAKVRERRDKEKKGIRVAMEGLDIGAILGYVLYMLKHNFNNFHALLTNLTQPPELLCLYLTLLTQYHIHSPYLIEKAIQSAFHLLQHYFTSPHLIIHMQDVWTIKQCCLMLGLADVRANVFCCAYCGQFQKGRVCADCGVVCQIIGNMGYNVMENCQIYEMFLSLCDYFIKFQLCRVKQQISTKLGEVISAIAIREYK